jgi:nucleotidyltransferase/DNA polymerase involved in DNA repair
MSSRVMNVLSSFTPDLEIYSIDEAFLGMDGFGGRLKAQTRAPAFSEIASSITALWQRDRPGARFATSRHNWKTEHQELRG